MRFSVSVFAALSITVTAILPRAEAHTLLVNPPPISPVDSNKTAPCGCVFSGDPACPGSFTTTTLTAGDAVLIKWKETVNHTGSFRLAFSTKAPDEVTSADLDANVIYDKPDTNDVAGATLSTTITVPDTPCDPCTIQLRQFMQGAANPYYYSCASVRIVDATASSSSSSTTGAGSGAGGDPTGGAGGAGQGGDPNLGEGGSTGPGEAIPPAPIQTGSCSATGSPKEAHFLFAIGALALGLVARRAKAGRSAA